MNMTEILENRVCYPPKAIQRSQLTPWASESHLQWLYTIGVRRRSNRRFFLAAMKKCVGRCPQRDRKALHPDK